MPSCKARPEFFERFPCQGAELHHRISVGEQMSAVRRAAAIQAKATPKIYRIRLAVWVRSYNSIPGGKRRR